MASIGPHGKISYVTKGKEISLLWEAARQREAEVKLEVQVMQDTGPCQHTVHLEDAEPCTGRIFTSKLQNAFVTPYLTSNLVAWFQHQGSSEAVRRRCAGMILHQVQNGLECLHRGNWIHRELEASNIWYDYLDDQSCPSGIRLGGFFYAVRKGSWFPAYPATYWETLVYLPDSIFNDESDSLSLQRRNEASVEVLADPKIDYCSLLLFWYAHFRFMGDPSHMGEADSKTYVSLYQELSAKVGGEGKCGKMDQGRYKKLPEKKE